MPEGTTPAPEGDQNQAEQDNQWQERYTGLQRVLSKRDETLAAAASELDSLKATHAADLAELTTFRERDAKANEEESARQTYEQLRQRFEPTPPVPVAHNAPNDGWVSDRVIREKTEDGFGSGWPT